MCVWRLVVLIWSLVIWNLTHFNACSLPTAVLPLSSLQYLQWLNKNVAEDAFWSCLVWLFGNALVCFPCLIFYSDQHFMDVIKKQASLKRLCLHIDTVLTNIWGWQIPCRNGILLTVALDTEDISQLGSPKHKQLKAGVYRITTQHISLLSALFTLGRVVWSVFLKLLSACELGLELLPKSQQQDPHCLCLLCSAQLGLVLSRKNYIFS